MGTLLPSTTILGVATGTGVLLYKKKIDPKALLIIGTAATATTAGEAIVKEHDLDEMNRKYNATTAAYVGSMSAEQLEEAMIRVGLLPGEDAENTTVKTI